jgi:hypothetical protein
VQGGPVFDVERLLHLRAGRHDVLKRSLAFALVGWLPPVVLATPFHGTGGALLALHVRYLVAIPLLLWAERFIDGRVDSAVRQFSDAGLVKGAEQDRYRAILAGCDRLRGSPVAQGLIALLAVALTFVENIAEQPWRTAPRSGWMAYLSLPLFRIVLGLWLWRWFIWALFLGRAARLDLQLVPTHPDRAGGLGFVEPTSLSFALIHVAMSAVMAAGLVGRFVLKGGGLATVIQLVAVFAVVVFGMIAGPLLFFIGPLVRAKQEGRLKYGALAQRHDQLFADRWIRSADGNPLGEPAISSLADIGTGFSYVQQMRLVPLGKPSLLLLAVVSISPVLPLLPIKLDVEQVVKHALSGLLL